MNCVLREEINIKKSSIETFHNGQMEKKRNSKKDKIARGNGKRYGNV